MDFTRNVAHGDVVQAILRPARLQRSSSHRTAFDTANDRRRPRRLEDALTTSHGRLANDTAGTATTSARAIPSVTLTRARVTADDIVAAARSRESTRDVSRRVLAHTPERVVTRGTRTHDVTCQDRRHVAHVFRNTRKTNTRPATAVTQPVQYPYARRLRRVRRHASSHGF